MSAATEQKYETPLTVRQAAERAGVHTNTIYKWIYKGFLVAYKTRTGKIKIKPADLESALYHEQITAG